MDSSNFLNWRNVLIDKNLTILSAIKKLDLEGLKILLVVDENEYLLGVITDGDIRRYILKNGKLEDTVDKVMNQNPIISKNTESKTQLLTKMKYLSILHLPIIDENQRLFGLETFNGLMNEDNKDNWVILMAGGLGKRLHPITVDRPKPLIKIGDKPILEVLLENFIKSGFRNYYFSINYKADMIRQYFGSGDRFGVNIHYIQENDALGTAGSLSLLPEKPTKPFFVVNADILTNINLDYLLEYHQKSTTKLHATICVSKHQHTIPFGLVHIDEVNHRLINI